MRWTTICFDLDNTLYSHEQAFEKAIRFCFESILKRKNLIGEADTKQLFKVFKQNCDLYWQDYESGTLTPKEYRRKRFLETTQLFQLPFDADDADEFQRTYYNVVDVFSEPFPKLNLIMNTLVAAQIKIGIITNGGADTQYNKVKELDLYEWIPNEAIFISEQLKIAKPNRQIFDIAKQKLESSGRYLFVGDSWEHDVVGAIEAGWDSIFLNTRMEKEKTAHKPFAVCTSLEGVAEVIFRENKLSNVLKG
ncbi:HAD family hydrolase [Bacillaceae bacterium IKA-2]|nr:HAD family hydrolase [Bacillaceae bacterium IKA-2]